MDATDTTSPEPSDASPTPSSTAVSSALPPATPVNRLITAREESKLIATLDDQIATISSRYTRRSVPPATNPPVTNPQESRIDQPYRLQEGGYTSLKRLAKDYHHLLQMLLSHQPQPKQFMTTQYLIRIIGDLNEQLPNLAVPEDPRGIFYVLKQIDEAVVRNLADTASRMSMTERVRLRGELERGRGVVGMTFEEYHGAFKVEEAIGRVYEKSLEEMEEPFDFDVMIQSGPVVDEFEDEDGLSDQDIVDDVDSG
jgi:Subunit 11 of the general transcription factor TFIIH